MYIIFLNHQVTMDYSLFIRRYEKRICDAYSWFITVNEAYELCKEKGEDHFLTVLEEQEDFGDFCKEYYEFLRENYNACNGMMWDQFEIFKSEFNSDRSKYWSHLQKELKER